jgi:glycosyltransferase involved in cell wall biosynthesis
VKNEPGVIGWVVIGRNEGDRLVNCFKSITGDCKVYVDSGSTDNSIANAQAFGFEVVNLDLKLPFTAARARNAGWKRLLELFPNTEFIMFVDGDCEVFGTFIELAREFLSQHPLVSVVCGLRQERYPEKSVYNKLCDIEWRTPVGEATACGGDAIFRSAILVQHGGYTSEMIAGEEPELCFRIRSSGGRIARIDALMTLHDSAIYRFAQWWQRTKRGGYAFALGYSLHHGKPALWKRELMRSVFWGLCLPILFISSGLVLAAVGYLRVFSWVLFAVPAIYVFHFTKLWFRFRKGGDIPFSRSWFMVVGKFAEAAGVVRFAIDLLLKRRVNLIEYK